MELEYDWDIVEHKVEEFRAKVKHVIRQLQLRCCVLSSRDQQETHVVGGPVDQEGKQRFLTGRMLSCFLS